MAVRLTTKRDLAQAQDRAARRRVLRSFLRDLRWLRVPPVVGELIDRLFPHAVDTILLKTTLGLDPDAEP